MNNSKISKLSRGLLLIVSGFLFISILFPLWRIELEAPQYPEGLVLQLHANKIAGNVDIINGLNHYIGMKTLHTEDFFEFSLLPYIFIGFALFAIIAFIIAKKKVVYIFFSSFMVFGILAAIDFYRWNYEYGHNLDPNAAIQVPGMAYQPPLLGYKQLLNFGAYSIPDTGGWMLIGAILLMSFIVLKEMNLIKKLKKTKVSVALLLLTFSILSCTNSEVVPIKLNKEDCDFCKMTISDGKFGAEIITQKGRVYKFDDILCLSNYCKENSDTKINAYYVHDFSKNNTLIPAETAFYIHGGELSSPMQGNIAAFSMEKEIIKQNQKLKGERINWNTIMKK